MTTSGTNQITASGRPDAAAFCLEVLDLLPCGCVIAMQRLAATGVRVLSLEAKGPHCPHLMHRANTIIRLGSPADPPDYDEEVEAA